MTADPNEWKQRSPKVIQNNNIVWAHIVIPLICRRHIDTHQFKNRMETFNIQVKSENNTENSFEDESMIDPADDMINSKNENSHEIDIKEENLLLQRDGLSYYEDFPGKHEFLRCLKDECC